MAVKFTLLQIYLSDSLLERHIRLVYVAPAFEIVPVTPVPASRQLLFHKCDRDIEKFKKVISPERQKALTPEIFQEILEAAAREQGELQSMELVTVLDQIVYQSYVWKLTYEKKDSEGKPVRRDFLYYVRIGKIGDGQYSIGASGFRL